MVCCLYLIRHGITEWNKQGKIQGHTDIDLSIEGKNQAQALAVKFQEIPFAAIYSSDLIRAKHTAEIIAKNHGLPVNTDPNLRERCWAEWEGKNVDDLRKEHGRIMHEFIENPQIKEPLLMDGIPSVETYHQANGRTIPCLLEIAQAFLGKKVLIVSHGGILRGLMHFFGYFDLPRPAFKNGDCLIIESDGSSLQMMQMVDHSNDLPKVHHSPHL